MQIFHTKIHKIINNKNLIRINDENINSYPHNDLINIQNHSVYNKTIGLQNDMTETITTQQKKEIDKTALAQNHISNHH